MTTTPGTRLGPYEIVARIGAGGMGEVFRARDTRLDRSVAIKVLPAEFAKNAALKMRFEREAKAISQLNHPHICTLYDVGDDYLVMELLDGETLADRLARGPLPLADVLKYGAQIADALDRAHRAGIVHRDLKPANVMLTKTGAKLLDFGLAKSATPQSNPDAPTVHHEKALTQEGTILGTFQYMAPEQLEGLEADARTDIFALGAVLHEMSTGMRAFEGKTRTSLIAAIVGTQPRPVSELIPLSPPALDHVIHKCLEKEADDRWQSAHDVGEELKWIATTPVAERQAASRVGKVAAAAAILLALALAAVTALWLRARNAPQPRAAFALLSPKGMNYRNHALSPDGTMVAFAANNARAEGGVWVRLIDQIEPKRLTTNHLDGVIAWSADSKWILYSTSEGSGARLMKVAATGGAPEVFSAQMRGGAGPGAWGPDGTLLTNRFFGDGIQAVRQDGATPRAVTTVDRARRESFHGYPVFLSDGSRFLYIVHTIADEKNAIWAGSLDGKVKKQLLRADSLVGVARGRLYFVRDGAIYAQSFDEADLQLTGEARRVVERVHFREPAVSADAFVGTNGALLYRPSVARTVEFGWYDRSGRRIEKVFAEEDFYPAALSPDLTRVVGTRFDPVKGADDIYVMDLARGVRTRVTAGLAQNFSPLWSRDGERIYFVSDRDGPFNLYVAAADGQSPAEPVLRSQTDKGLDSISPSGDLLLVAEHSPETRDDLWLVPLAAPHQKRAFAASESNECCGEFSRDGKWITYRSDRSGRQELYIRPVAGGKTTQVSTQGTVGYVWNHVTGNELLVRTLQGDRASIPLTFNGNEVIAGKATFLFTPPTTDYAMLGAFEKGIAMWTVPDPADYRDVLHYESAPDLDR
jgi:Tol biopolymer transport system component/predicted Ser/Thr protein kinase